MKTIAIIPAKGNSIRIPGKNCKILGDKPLVAWTIEFANKLYEKELINDIILSTNSKEIEDIGRNYGNSNIIIHKRSEEFCVDNVTNLGVVREIVKDLNDYDYILLLQPTSPFRKIETFKRIFVDCVPTNNGNWFIRSYYHQKGLLFEYIEDIVPLKTYAGIVYRTGTFYLYSKAFIKDLKYKELRSFVTWHEAININTQDDWELAECIAESFKI